MSRAATTRRKHRHSQRGFALLVVVFLAALMLVAAMGASLSVVTDGKREKEREMIWRGKQYIRAVKLFYRKNGRFPAEVDDLAKAKTGSLRFLRQAYKDPMNKADGTWRLIYVGPSGQLIGSLKPHPLFRLPSPAPGAATPGSAAGAPGGTGTAGTGTGTGQPGATGTAGAAPGAGGTTGTSGDASGASGQSGPGGQGGSGSGTGTGTGDLPPGNVDSPTVFGGKIIGVGSKIDGPSVIVYDKARNYRLFEFIWDPSKDTGGANQPLQSIPGGSVPGQPGQPGPGGPGNPNPNPNPPAPPTQN